MPRLLRLLTAAAVLAATPVAVSPALADDAPPPATAPRLIVAISVDQFSADLFAQYRQRFTGGFARLLQGAVFPSAFQSHAATETCPGHSTLLTGDHPARTGIIANNWFDWSVNRADKRVYCAEDERDPASTVKDPVVSAWHLRVPTLGEWIKRAWPASRNVAVSAKDRAVMMMGGHAIDAAYWYKAGAFTTFKGHSPSAAAQAENADLAKLLAKGAPPLTPPAWCAATDRAVPVGKGEVGAGRFALAPNQPDSLRISPRMDGATADLADRLIDEMKLGQGPAPDLLSVSFSATDYVGHAYGTEGMEMCLQMAGLDAAIGRLLSHLDARHIDYAVVLSADHGGLDTPERLDAQALPRAVRADPALAPQALAKVVSGKTGIVAAPGTGPLIAADAPFGDFTVNRALAPADRAKVVAALVALLHAHPQVAAAFTAADIAKTPLPTANPQDWTLIERARASFDPERSGDVVVLLDRAVVPIPEGYESPGSYVATHGSAWDYDRRVPLLFWRKGLPGFEQPQPVETVDIAPSLAALIGLRLPEGTFDGRCLDLDGGPGNTCGLVK